MSEYRLREEVGRLLRERRIAARLSQEQLARLAGVSQPLVSRVERGGMQVSLDVLDQLFGALDLQVRVGTERTGAHLESEIDRITLTPAGERLKPWSRLLTAMSALGAVFEGPLAAVLHGVPIPVEAADVVIAPHALDAFTQWLQLWGAQRWSERWHEFSSSAAVDPREPGRLLWRVGIENMRARVCRRLPDSISVCHDGTSVRVRPLDELELTDPLLATVLNRYRRRLAAGLMPVETETIAAPLQLPDALMPSWARRRQG